MVEVKIDMVQEEFALFVLLTHRVILFVREAQTNKEWKTGCGCCILHPHALNLHPYEVMKC